MSAPLGTVITFYSYKGGVGRTLAMANVAALLARWGRKVLCIDWDLEAPGLHQYFREQVPLSELRDQPGVVELVEAWSRGAQVDWRAHARPIDVGRGQTLTLMPAGRLDDGYVARMQTLDWADLFERGFGGTLEDWRDEWKQAYDFILVDSRTGVSDIGGMCTIQLPDQLVLCVTANEQSLQGAKDVAERAARQRQRLPFDRAGVPCVPLPTRFEGRVESALAKQWLERFASELVSLYRQWIVATISPRQLLDLLKIPYVPLWSFGEGLPVVSEGTTDPESIGFAFETLAALLARGLSDTDALLARRDEYVGEVTGSVAGAANAAGAVEHDVFVGYNAAGVAIASTLAERLRRAGLRVFFDQDSLLPGSRREEVVAAARSSPHVVYVIGASHAAPALRSTSEATGYLREIVFLKTAGRSRRSRIIPVLAPGATQAALPLWLLDFQAVELTGVETVDEVAYRRIAEALRPTPAQRASSASSRG